MKYLKKTIWLLAGLLLVLIIALAIFVLTFDANRYKPEIAAQVERITGRSLMIAGDIKLSLFPWLGLEIAGVELANAEGFGPQPFARVDRLDVKVKFLPLLEKQVSVDQIQLNGLFLSLHQKADGLNNWSDLAAAGVDAAPAQPAVTTEPQVSDDVATELAAFMVNGVTITDAVLHWQDDVSGQSIKLEPLNLTTGAIVVAERVPLQLSLVAELKQPQMKVELTLTTGVSFNPDSGQLVVDGIELGMDIDSPELATQHSQLQLTGKIQADINQQRVSIENLVLALQSQGTALPGQQVAAELRTSLAIDLPRQTLQAHQFKLESLGVTVQGNVDVSQMIDRPQLKGHVQIAEFSPATVSQQLDVQLPKMKHPAALKTASAALDYVASLDSARLNNIILKLDESTLTGNIELVSFAQPSIRYQLTLDQMQLDDYLPPVAASQAESETNAAAATAGQAAADVPIELPEALLRSLDVEGALRVKQLRFMEHKASDLLMQVKGAKGVIRIQPLKLNVLNGTVDLAAQLNLQQPMPHYQADIRAQGLEAASVANPVLRSLLGEEAVAMDGVLNLSANVATQGRSVNALTAALNGKLALNMPQATLSGVDAEYFARNLVVDYAAEKKIPVKPEWRGVYNPKQTTAFKTMRATAVIRQGVINNQDLLLDSRRLKITGAGTVDLPKQQLNYRTVADIEPASRKTSLEKLLDVPVPVNVKGSFAQPDIGVDMKTWRKGAAAVVKQETKAKVQEKVDKKIDTKKDELREKLKDKFKDLLNR